MRQKKTHLVTNIVFVISFIIVILSSVSIFFPALIPSLTIEPDNFVEPFEPGVWSIPVLFVNLFLLFFGIAYVKGLIPKTIKKGIHFILDFEIKPKIAFISITFLLAIYVVFSFQDLAIYELEEWGDFRRIETALKEFPYIQQEGSLQYIYVKMFLVFVSQEIFQNVKIIPFIASISLLVLTYFFTLEISKKRFAGIIAVIILLQSNTFRIYDVSATYSSFWILFYLLSLYLIYKKWSLSLVAFVASILSKPITVMFLPMTFFVIYQSKISKNKKIRLFASYGAIIVIGGIVFASVVDLGDRITSFDHEDFWSGFTTLSFQLRSDGFVLVFLIPLVVALFLVSKKGILQANSVLILISGVLLSSSLLVAFTTYDMQPYRYLALLVFFAIGFGALFSKRITLSTKLSDTKVEQI